jgi:hypothetical protein
VNILITEIAFKGDSGGPLVISKYDPILRGNRSTLIGVAVGSLDLFSSVRHFNPTTVPQTCADMFTAYSLWISVAFHLDDFLGFVERNTEFVVNERYDYENDHWITS